MALIRWLKDISVAHTSETGSKAALLGSVINMGWNVPPGLVVMPEFFNRFTIITNIDSKISNLIGILNFDDEDRLQTIANEIQRLIIDTPMPSGLASELTEYYEAMTVSNIETSESILAERKDPTVAVRTSVALPELPGTFGMYMNIKGKERVIKAVQACWASRFTLKVLKTLHERGIGPQDPTLSVIVQKMIVPTKSGDIYTSDERGSQGQMVIDAYWGIREVSEPDLTNADTYWVSEGNVLKSEIRKKASQYVKDIETGKIIRDSLTPKKSESEVLDDVQVKELANMASRVRKQLQDECRITWAYLKDTMYVLRISVIEGKKMDDADRIIKEATEPQSDDLISTAIDAHQEKYGSDDNQIMDIEEEIESEDFQVAEKVPEPEPAHEQTWKPQKEPEQLLESANEMAGHAVGNALRAVTLKLRMRYAELYNKMPPEYLTELVEEMSQELQIPHKEELLSIYQAYLGFIREYDTLNPQMVASALRIADELVRTFQ